MGRSWLSLSVLPQSVGGMDDELLGACPARLAALPSALLAFHPLLIAPTACPPGHQERLEVFGSHRPAENGLSLGWFVPNVHPFAAFAGVKCSFPARRVHAIRGPHRLWNRTAMLATQVMRPEPVHDTGQIVQPIGRIVGLSEVVCPAAYERLDAHEQIEFWNLCIAT